MTTRFKVPALAIAGALFVSTVTAPAFAGEVTGNGKLTPGGDNAASICHFSGLNDHPNGAPGDFPGKIQNFAHFLFWLAGVMGLDRLSPQDVDNAPGDACRGNLDFEE
jgi:hypothetical protein